MDQSNKPLVACRALWRTVSIIAEWHSATASLCHSSHVVQIDIASATSPATERRATDSASATSHAAELRVTRPLGQTDT